MRLLERLRKGFGGTGNSDQVHVIRHQAVAQKREAVELKVLPHQLKIGHAISIAGQNNLSGISPLRNMMGNVGNDDARQPSHGKKIPELIVSADTRSVFVCRNSRSGSK
jgi:hypothetical protein